MNDTCARRGPNPALFLLIPLAFMAGKNAARHQAMHRAAWAAHEGAIGPEAGGAPGMGAGMGPGFGFGPWAGFGHGFRRGFGGWAGQNVDPDTVQIPPFIERVLGAWHTRAHQAGDQAGETQA